MICPILSVQLESGFVVNKCQSDCMWLLRISESGRKHGNVCAMALLATQHAPIPENITMNTQGEVDE